MQTRQLLSTIQASPVSDFIYSAYGWYAPRHGGELPGLWFVRTLTSLGFEEAAVRMTLFRMERSGALTAQRSGRTKMYAATPATRAIAAAGRSRVFSDDPEWDGRWSIVTFGAPPGEGIRDVLMVEGFQKVGGTTWVHPRDRIARVLEAADDAGMFVFRGTLEAPRALKAVRLWALDAVASRYRMFVRRYTPLKKGKLPPFEAFVARHAMMSEFFRITWSDPGLPSPLLPAGWPGDEAKRLARTLYERLLPAATEYADGIFDEVSNAR